MNFIKTMWGLLIGGLFIAPLPLFAYPGELDTSFNSDGIGAYDVNVGSVANAIAVQSDGKIVLAGTNNNDFVIIRLNTDGTLDTTFGGDGMVTTDFNGGSDAAYAVAIQSDGKIVAAGRGRGATRFDIALARYNTNGTLDTSFRDGQWNGQEATAGRVTTDERNWTSDAEANAMAIQSDGKIVVFGTLIGIDRVMVVARYDSDGATDVTFGQNGGLTIFDMGAGNNTALDVALTGDGKILLGGLTWTNVLTLLRYSSSGSMDTTFGVNGLVYNSSGYEIALQSDGKIVVGGNAGNNFTLARYNSDGTPDNSYGVNHVVTTDLGGVDRISDITIQTDGKIVAVGTSDVGGDIVARYNTDGTLDTGFDSDGWVGLDLQVADGINGMSLQPDGKIAVVGGTSFTAGRLHAAPPQVSIGDANGNEGGNATFTVTLSYATGQIVTVDYATSGGTAVLGTDFTAANGTLTFTAGQTSKTITVPLRDELVDEPDEQFTLTLSNPTNALLGNATGIGTISDVNPVPFLSIANTSVTEGSGGTNTVSITVTLSAASGKTITVDLATADGTGRAGSDYTATSGTVTFLPGETTKTIAVTIGTDSSFELDETFTLRLSSPVNAAVSTAAATVTIVNDDTEIVTGAGGPTEGTVGRDSDDGDSGTTSSEVGEVSGWSCVGQDPVTGEVICTEVAVEADGTCSLVCDGDKADDGSSVKVLIVATQGASSSSALAVPDLTSGDGFTLAKYFEAATGSTEFDAGDVDLTETLPLLVEEETESQITGCGVAYRRDLFDGAGLGEDGTEGGLAAVRDIAQCLIARHYEGVPAPPGYTNPLQLASDLVNGRIEPSDLAPLIARAVELCGLTEEELERVYEAVAVLPDLWAFSGENVAGDATSCAMVQNDPEEREAWVGITYALEPEPSLFEEESTAAVVVELIQLARERADYRVVADPARARILIAAFQQVPDEGMADTARLETIMELTEQINLEEVPADEEAYSQFGEEMVETIWTTDDETLETYREQADQVGNYLWGEFVQRSLSGDAP